MARRADGAGRCRGGPGPFSLEATEQDDELALRGYLISRTGVLPTDPRFQQLSSNDTLLRFTVHWLRKRENDLMDWVTRVLGVVWTRDDVKQMGGTSTTGERVFLPLALGVNTDLSEALQQMFRGGGEVAGGEYRPELGEEIVELGDMPADRFKQWAARAMGALSENADVTLGNETAHDPKIERMREQIAHSKRTV